MNSLGIPSKKLRGWVYLSGFFLYASIGLITYINSSFYEQFVGPKYLGLIYSVTSILMLILALNIQTLVEKIGLRSSLLLGALFDFAALAGLIWLPHQAGSIIFLVAHIIFTYLLAILLDWYLEHLSEDSQTGSIRGTFLASMNLAIFASPLLAGYALGQYGFSAVYLLSGLAFIPFVLLLLAKLKNLPQLNRPPEKIRQTIWQILWPKTSQFQDIRRAITMDFTLNFFYAVMIVYTPIYLSQQVGMAWTDIGLVFTIMLIPFVILDLVLGPIADKWLGEKELMIAGIGIMAAFTAAIPFLITPTVWLWALVLFMTRVGAASLEAMKDSYLFKKVGPADVNIIFISRSMYPFSYLIAPALGSILLIFVPFPVIFFVLSALLLTLALPIAINLRDTR